MPTEEPPPELPDPTEPIDTGDVPEGLPPGLPDPTEPEYRSGFPRIRGNDE